MPKPPAPKVFYIAVAMVVLLACACVPALSAESEREVVVEGYAFVKGFADAAVIEMARESARRRAIEEGGETVIERHSSADNFALIRDVILTDTRGLLRNQDWILYPGGKDYQVRDDKLYVKLRATVKVGRIENDLPAIAEVLRRRGQPRIVMLVKEERGTGIDDGVVAAEVESLLIDKQFRILDAAMADEISVRELNEFIEQPQRAEALFRRLNADYVIMGVVRAERQEPFVDGGMEMVRSAVTARFSIVDRHLGGKLAVVQHAFHTRPATKDGAANMLQTALVTTGRNLANELLSKLLDQLGRQTASIEIVLSNANRTKLDNLRESLLKMGGKQNFVTRSMRKGEAVVDWESQFPIDAVASYIELQDDAPLALTDQLESKLICEFK